MLSGLKGGAPTVTIIEMVVVPRMVFVTLTNAVLLTAYISTLVDLTDEWLDPFWERVKGRCYVQITDEVQPDESLVHRSGRLLEYLLTPACPGKECGRHGKE